MKETIGRFQPRVDREVIVVNFVLFCCFRNKPDPSSSSKSLNL
jgi:hypothetical protein